ncbi:MAG: 2,3-bisphosphoglycerate-independent phosphoglycerate mutase [bacterium]|nr:2,3-bisphosphoglycerate-independent phosphoglycerate mutase [bacterium]
MSTRPLILIVLDGWGISPVTKDNPMFMAKTPVMRDLPMHYPYGVLDASGTAVGLPWGEVGNSEVGHLNLGAGLVRYQDLPRINASIEDKSFAKNKVLKAVFAHVKKNKSNLHLLGIVSPGGVHGHVDHLYALLRTAKKEKIKNVFIHAITDGRDSPPRASEKYFKELDKVIKETKTGIIATITGRYFAMDRNTKWDRTQKAYDAMTLGKGTQAKDAQDALKSWYKKGIDDEMIEPTVMTDKEDQPVGTVHDNDAVVFFNFRPDRARQLAKSFIVPNFKEFKRESIPQSLCFVTMTEYEKGLPADYIFPPEYIETPFGKIVADAGLRQLRIAETEKYAHVTYFFNGGSEEQYEKEDRILVPSPKVATYDKKPEMSAMGITKKLCNEISAKKYTFILVNFANADMVAHTGKLKPTIKALETVDTCVGLVVKANQKQNGITVITADHGNAEGLVDRITGQTDKEHSTNPVPFIVVDDQRKQEKEESMRTEIESNINPAGILADVAPTLCALLDLKPAKEMTGSDILENLM